MPGQTEAVADAGDVGAVASMEGRTIARPNLARDTQVLRLIRLQWRAGQLPGQTTAPNGGFTGNRRQVCFNGGPDNCPAKHACHDHSAVTDDGFNGGPDNCPAKPLDRFGLSDLPVRGHLRAVLEAYASKVPQFGCQGAIYLA